MLNLCAVEIRCHIELQKHFSQYQYLILIQINTYDYYTNTTVEATSMTEKR